jgi:Rieske Fe-S protein
VHERSGGRYVIFGGGDHKTGQASDTEACFEQVRRVLLDLIPSAAIERRWSGQVIETDDGLPFIGEVAEHQYVATGFAGNGLTFGTLAGMIICDEIAGIQNPWRDLFHPGRKPSTVSAVRRLIAENIDYPSHYVGDRLREADGSGVENVPRGAGKVITLDGRRVAVHRTDDGEVIKVDAMCTHMGCIVRWNTAERTWDCPCHGSRFSPEGQVVGGPAEAPLGRLEQESAKG